MRKTVVGWGRSATTAQNFQFGEQREPQRIGGGRSHGSGSGSRRSRAVHGTAPALRHHGAVLGESHRKRMRTANAAPRRVAVAAPGPNNMAGLGARDFLIAFARGRVPGPRSGAREFLNLLLVRPCVQGQQVETARAQILNHIFKRTPVTEISSDIIIRISDNPIGSPPRLSCHAP